MLKKWKDIFSKKDEIIIQSPVQGEACEITQVNDATFRDKLLGEGIAIRPSTGRVVAPVNGMIAILFETKHACTIVSDQGTEILIHIGLDTVNLKGKYYKAYVKDGDKVKAGDLILEFDMDKIKEAGYDLITPVVICNSADYSKIQTFSGNQVQELEPIMSLQK
ncbi:MAG TPA: PTS glucose transporter subunit IIA [Lachnospiraceae bacterium]|jgi:PTS system beta-glucosides-specific IIC component|nr:PTS glucose transporter subunit IIA [Lachnospiraceae bacterium]